jgi:hypothetical protein
MHGAPHSTEVQLQFPEKAGASRQVAQRFDAVVVILGPHCSFLRHGQPMTLHGMSIVAATNPDKKMLTCSTARDAHLTKNVSVEHNHKPGFASFNTYASVLPRCRATIGVFTISRI